MMNGKTIPKKSLHKDLGGKTHGSESRGLEGTKRTPNQKKNATTTVSHLHDGTVSQFLKSAWRNLRLTKRFISQA